MAVIAVLFALMPYAPAHASFDFLLAGARPAGLAGAFAAVADDANSPFLNPAGMSQLQRPEITNFYSVLYGVEGLSQMMLAGVAPTRIGAFGLYYQALGGALYRESDTGVAFSHRLGGRIMIGVTARLLGLSIARYGSVRATTFDAGMLVRLPGGVRIGGVMRNIRRLQTAGHRPQSPRVTHLGISRASERLTVSLQVEHHPRYGWTTSIGQEYLPASMLAIRVGIRAQPSEAFFGVGIAVSRFEVSYAIASHPALGSTHRASITMRFPARGAS